MAVSNQRRQSADSVQPGQLVEAQHLTHFGHLACWRLAPSAQTIAHRTLVRSANNLQQSWRFDWEPPKAVLRDVMTIDWILRRVRSSAQADSIAGRPVLGF